MSVQEGTFSRPGHHVDTDACRHIARMLSRIGGKWTIPVVRELEHGPLRFNALKRQIGDVSQKALASTLRDLEEDGFVERRVAPIMPPQVEYSLTSLGTDFVVPVKALASWMIGNAERIDEARASYASRLSETI